jgi:hypothetical protein
MSLLFIADLSRNPAEVLADRPEPRLFRVVAAPDVFRCAGAYAFLAQFSNSGM